MDEDCEYVRSSYLVQLEPTWSQLEDRLDVIIGRDMNFCRESAIDDMEILEFSRTVTPTERVNRMLFLLHRDILGTRLGMLIMEKKFIRDAYYQHKILYPSYALQFAGAPATQRQLIIFAVAATLFAIAMLGYLLYFSLAATPQRQRGWVSSFIIWLVLDFCLVSTLEALTVHVAIPSAVTSDLDNVKLHIAEVTSNALFQAEDPLPSSSSPSRRKNSVTVNQMEPAGSPAKSAQGSPTKSPHKSINGSDEKGEDNRMVPVVPPLKKLKPFFSLDVSSTKDHHVGFNSASFFSTAHRLSRYFSDCNESRFIQSYSSLLPPGHLCKNTWLDRKSVV